MTEKILGYLLLTIGIITIVLSGASVYSVFTKKSTPVAVFNFKSISIDMGQLLPSNLSIPENLPPEVASLLKSEDQPTNKTQKAEILPAEILNTTSNLFAHLLLMGFIASIGFKLASLGIMLVRPIKVKLNTEKSASN